MRGLFTFIAIAAVWITSAGALTGEAVPLRDGPGGEGRDLAPVWVMRCDPAARLVGVRIREDRQIISLEAICAVLRFSEGRTRWVTAPVVVAPPPPPPTPVRVVKRTERQEGTVLRASSSGISRFRGSKALIISVGLPDPRPEDQVEDPSIDFRDTGARRDLLCSAGQYVAGLKTGSEQGRRSERLSALQLICADGSPRGRHLVGEWPVEQVQPKARKQRKSRQAPLKSSLVECGSVHANPHDGAAVQALFGTVDDGRVQTVGISCARTVDGAAARSHAYAGVRSAVLWGLRAVKWQRVFDDPSWIDGRPLATCPGRGTTGAKCSQASADRFCQAREGYGGAATYAVGGFSSSTVGVEGEACERRSCRKFARITCSF